MPSPAARAALLVPCALTLLACGARASLLDGATVPGSGGGGAGTIATSGTGGAGGLGGAGGGAGGVGATGGAGGAGACTTLVWAGPPVLVPVAKVLNGPWLVRTDLDTLALVFDDAVPDATLLESAALPLWWTAWPPAVGPVATAHPLTWQLGHHAVAAGEPGTFTYAYEDFQGMVVGQAKPGAQGTPVTSWPVVPTQPRSLARNNGGSYLLASGPDGALGADVLPDLMTPPIPPLVPFACAAPSVTAAAVGLGDDAFLVAATSDQPIGSCVDPVLPGPPTFVAVHRFSSSGPSGPPGFVPESGPVFDLQLVGRVGGAWLAYRVAGDATLHIRSVDDQGVLGPPDWSVFGSPVYGDAVAALGPWFAHATVFPGGAAEQGPPFVVVYVRTDGGTVQIDQLGATELHPTGRPAIAVSDDGRSILIAFRNDAGDGSPASIGLLRADCAP
jgi:hypothetical protein